LLRWNNEQEYVPILFLEMALPLENGTAPCRYLQRDRLVVQYRPEPDPDTVGGAHPSPVIIGLIAVIVAWFIIPGEREERAEIVSITQG
jgi:hypothetical protein